MNAGSAQMSSLKLCGAGVAHSVNPLRGGAVSAHKSWLLASGEVRVEVVGGGVPDVEGRLDGIGVVIGVTGVVGVGGELVVGVVVVGLVVVAVVVCGGGLCRLNRCLRWRRSRCMSRSRWLRGGVVDAGGVGVGALKGVNIEDVVGVVVIGDVEGVVLGVVGVVTLTVVGVVVVVVLEVVEEVEVRVVGGVVVEVVVVVWVGGLRLLSLCLR